MIVVVPLDPPEPGLVLTGSGLEPTAAASLYEASTTDVLQAVAASGGDLLVTYRDEETLPAGASEDPASAVAALVDRALPDEDVRLERQVGSTPDARLGNTVTHLLEREDAASVGVLSPTAPLVERTHIDGAAMSLRRSEVVLGPSEAGGVYFAGFSEPIDFTDVLSIGSPVASLTDRAVDAGLSVDFAPTVPTIDSQAGLETTRAIVTARDRAGRRIPVATAAALED